MTFVRTAAPTVLPVDVRAAADNMGVDGTELDARIEGWLRGITATLERRIGQCLMRQRWEGAFAGFLPEFRLPHPVLEVEKVEYVDTGGTLCQLTATDYRLVRGEYDTYLRPAIGRQWPASLLADGAVNIVVSCGYGDDPSKTPDDLRLYLLAKLGEQFDPATGSERENVHTSFVESLLDPYRRFN
ncbi:hypothetical protein GM658_12545 [Pseudoduganella eburnea]|uniref:Phage gp6-like head-tail connector protein n=1 Tax=Massilia eburnea TaxID=1776165 RepID=A0A6L6QIF9_9BURK|nr:hypothetical protein [Massilia eburnea]MTW11426.1 hypothetical protein [Massilia eburnea]